jgi:hypothetical protein
VPCTPTSAIADVRASTDYAQICLNNATVVFADSFGNAKVDGGTQYPGNWYVADSTGALISVYKGEYESITAIGIDPTEGQVVNITGLLEVYPQDGGPGSLPGTYQIASSTLNFALGTGSAALPSATSVSADEVDETSATTPVGTYVTLQSGNYSENPEPTEFTYDDTAKNKTYYDGLSLSDGNSTVLVDTFTFGYSTGNCLPPDGGQPDLSAGGFNGILDTELTDDGKVHYVIFYAQCGAD